MASLLHSKLDQFELRDGTGVPAASYYLHFFTTGTTTYKNTYPTEADAIAGTNANANPIQLNSEGRPGVDIWITGRYKRVFTSESTVPISSGITTDPIEDSTPASDFQDGSQIFGGTAGGTATAITFSLTPAITAYTDGMEVGWRWNADTAAGGTTINVNGVGAKSLVKRDGTAIAAGDGQQNDVAAAKYNSTQNRFELVTSEGMLYRDGNNAPARADVASAATVNLDTAGTVYARITGTTTITAITLTDGREREVVFGGALVLTHGASLILPGAANITTAAGDTARFRGEAAGVVRCVSYTVASSGPSGLTLGTEVATTSGTSVAIASSIPPGVKRITISFQGVSTNGAGDLNVQLGDSGGLETTGYASSSALLTDAGAVAVASSTSGFLFQLTAATNVATGHMFLTLVDAANNEWVESHTMKISPTEVVMGGGTKALSATLDRISLVGSDTFDAGSINILYE